MRQQVPTKVSEHTRSPSAAAKDVEIAGPTGANDRPSFRIETHGCKLNMADSQVLAGQFMARGFRASNDGEEPGVYVVNTCTVTSVADKKARQAISSARRRFPGAIVVAAGCYPERDRTALEALGRLTSSTATATRAKLSTSFPAYSASSRGSSQSLG